MLPLLVAAAAVAAAASALDFRADGTFTVLQVGDMHIVNGARTACRDVDASFGPCSDLNTSDFVRRAIRSVRPDLVVFTGDNVECEYGTDECADVLTSLKLAFSPAIEAGVPWIATLGNHDEKAGPQQRAAMMKALTQFPGFAAQLGNATVYNGAGTFALHVGAPPSPTGPSGLTLLALDSGGDLAPGDYDHVHADQLLWLERAVADARRQHAGRPPPAALAFLHIPLPEYTSLVRARVNISGANQQQVGSSAHENGAAFAAVERARDVKALFCGHDHVNDYCGLWRGVQLCYAGGAGYHAYGQPGWARRLRVIRARHSGRRVVSWKVLDAQPAGEGLAAATDRIAPVDCELLWAADGHGGPDAGDCAGMPHARRHPPLDAALMRSVPRGGAVKAV